jgi:magnesium and cobalt transporter
MFEEIVGILYVKDLLGVDTNGNTTFNVESILRPPLFIPKTKKVSDLLQTFKLQKTHIAIVVDEYGLTAGLVTIEDILEEIVGDIQDEYDVEEPGYEVQEDGSIIADAKVDLDILIEVVNIEFPEKDVETLGGFISTLMGTVPKVDETIEYENYKFTILDSDERKINKVYIEPLPRDQEANEVSQVQEPEPQNQS